MPNEKNAPKKTETSPVATKYRLPKFVRRILWGVGMGILALIIVILTAKSFFSVKKVVKDVGSSITNKSGVLQYREKLLAQINAANKKTVETLKKTKKLKHDAAVCAAGLPNCNDKKLLAQRALEHRSDPLSPFKVGKTSKGNNDTVSSGHSSMDSVDAQKILHPGYIISAGQSLHAVLNNAIDSTQPGLVTGHLTDDAWSSDGSRILLPRFTKLVGHYDGRVKNGQASIYVIWDRASTPKPNPLSIDLDSETYDALGRAGQKADSIDSHFFQRFGMASLMSIIGASVATQGVESNDSENSSNAMREGVAASFQTAAGTALAQGMAIPPTMHVYQGARITIMVSKDLNFYKVLPHG